jgi:hypothetical protein
LRTTNDSFAAYRANLNIKENTVEEYKQSQKTMSIKTL